MSKKKGKTVISLINASGYFGNSFFEPVPMTDIKLNIPGSFKSAEALNGGLVTMENGMIRLNRLNEFEMIVLEEKSL